MDELELSGKRYISTRRAGRENGYHSDYIGQLIRGGKVVGQKVGRSWYVDEESLALYLGKAYTPPISQIENVPVAVAPILEPVTIAAAPAVEVPIQPQQVSMPVQVHVVATEAQQPIQAASTEERAVPIHTEAPVAVFKATTEEKTSPVGLRYVEDDKDPMLPVVTRMPEEEYAHEQLIPTLQPRRSTKAVRVALLAATAVVVMGVGVAVSAFLNVTVRINNAQTATVFYSIKN